MLGQMHIAGQSFGNTMNNPRGANWRKQTAQQVKPFLSEADTALLDSEIALHQIVTSQNLPQGVIHADLFCDNVLFENARIGGLIDFYFACNDYLLYDIAITVNDWCTNSDGTLDEERTQSLLRAYHAVRPLQETERDAWSNTLRKAALRFWLSRLYDLHLPREGEMVHAHDPDQYKQILQRHIAANDAIIWL